MKVILTAVALFAATTIFAQKTDFSGTWLFQGQESISGNLYSNGSPKKVKITQEASKVSLEKTSDRGDGTEVVLTDVVGFDGKGTETIGASKRKKVVSLSWSVDDKTFTSTVMVYSAADNTKLERVQRDTYSMDEGKLIIDRRDENKTNDETWESKAVYTKQ